MVRRHESTQSIDLAGEKKPKLRKITYWNYVHKNIDKLIDWIVFYAVSAIFQPYKLDSDSSDRE